MPVSARAFDIPHSFQQGSQLVGVPMHIADDVHRHTFRCLSEDLPSYRGDGAAPLSFHPYRNIAVGAASDSHASRRIAKRILDCRGGRGPKRSGRMSRHSNCSIAKNGWSELLRTPSNLREDLPENIVFQRPSLRQRFT